MAITTRVGDELSDDTSSLVQNVMEKTYFQIGTKPRAFFDVTLSNCVCFAWIRAHLFKMSWKK